MNITRLNNYLNQVQDLENGSDILVEPEVVPEVGAIQQIAKGTNIIEVHSGEDNGTKESVRFSITHHPKTKPIKDLPLRIMDVLGGSEISSLGYGRIDAINDPMWFEYEVVIPSDNNPSENNVDVNLQLPAMEKWIQEQLQNFDFNRAPRTKKLMQAYLSITYEGSADYSDESMRRELNLLNSKNEVALMLIQEVLDHPESSGHNLEDVDAEDHDDVND